MAESNPTVALLPDHDSLAKDPRAVADFSKETDALVERFQQVFGAAALQEATETCLVLEKKARQANDGLSVSRLSCHLLKMYKDAQKWDDLCELAVTLCKKRGQLKRAISDMMTFGTSLIEDIVDRDIRYKLLRTFSSIAEGKIFVEAERARLIRSEAQMLEEEGKTSEAALLLQEVQVETLGAMDRKEKTEYILDQMRLVLLRKDWVRLQIVSKKINPKFLEAEDFHDLKLQYFDYMIVYHLHEEDYLNTAKSYWAKFNTPKIQNTEAWKDCLSYYVMFLILAPHGDEPMKLLDGLRINEKKKLNQITTIFHLVTDILSTELVQWPLRYNDQIRCHPIFQEETSNAKWLRFRGRFMQHNVLILSKYYSRIPTVRAARLMQIDACEVEERVAELVNDKIIAAKIDRPAGVVAFGKPVTSQARLDAWASDISKLLDLLQETTHLINNDRMVQSALEKRKMLLEKSKA